MVGLAVFKRVLVTPVEEVGGNFFVARGCNYEVNMRGSPRIVVEKRVVLARGPNRS